MTLRFENIDELRDEALRGMRDPLLDCIAAWAERKAFTVSMVEGQLAIGPASQAGADPRSMPCQQLPSKIMISIPLDMLAELVAQTASDT